jgi:Na+/H+ antiporter NhaD/arsenite permease-like protein
MMETIEYFSDFLKKIGAPNFLSLGIVIIVIWLLISGLRKGLKKRGGRDKEPQGDDGNRNEDVSE